MSLSPPGTRHNVEHGQDGERDEEQEDDLGIHQRGVQSEGGAVGGGSIIQ